TVQTQVTKIEDGGAARSFSEEELQTAVGEIIDADIKMEHFCPKHHVLQAVNRSTLMTRCDRCQAFCKTSKTKVEFQGHVTVKVQAAQQKINLDNCQIRDLLSVKDEELVDAHSLITDILVHDEILIQTWREYVIKISFVDRSCSSDAACSVAVEQTPSTSKEASVFELEGEEAAVLEVLFEEGQ
ncbi:MAG: hypothetical protein ACRCZO_18540, partial [Cetobacterium sp.]